MYNCNVNIYFNQKCLRKNSIPNYAIINTPNTSPASEFTQQKIYYLLNTMGMSHLKKGEGDSTVANIGYFFFKLDRYAPAQRSSQFLLHFPMVIIVTNIVCPAPVIEC
jgi:hypothetical protein